MRRLDEVVDLSRLGIAVDLLQRETRDSESMAMASWQFTKRVNCRKSIAIVLKSNVWGIKMLHGLIMRSTWLSHWDTFLQTCRVVKDYLAKSRILHTIHDAGPRIHCQ